MAKTYSEAEVIENVIAVRASPTRVQLSYMEDLGIPGERRYRSAKSFRNEKGINFVTIPWATRIEKISTSPKSDTIVEFDRSPMTCIFSTPTGPQFNGESEMRCSANTERYMLTEVLEGGMHGPIGAFTGMEPHTADAAKQNVARVLGIESYDEIDSNVQVVKLDDPKVAERSAHHYTQQYYIEDAIRDRLQESIIVAVEQEAQRNVDEMPAVVFRKVNSQYMLDALVNGGFVNSSGNNSWSDQIKGNIPVREDPQRPPSISFSEEYLGRCELKTPHSRQEVTMVMRIPETSCPVRVKYAPNIEEFYGNDRGALYPIAVARHIESTNPDCDCITESYIAYNAQFAMWESEKEIVMTECNSGRVRFKPEDVLYLVAETQCGIDLEEIKTNVELTAPEYADRVISFEQWKEIETSVLEEESREKEKVGQNSLH